MSYPHTETERAELRTRLEEEAAERARIGARRNHLSIRCWEDDHGCANSGKSCLCQCHDQKDLP